MAKEFNTTAVCIPKLHYMVNLHSRLEEIKKMVDAGKYFTINRARQYGKTTILRALSQYLQSDYYVVSMDFQMFDFAKFQNAHIFSLSFGKLFLKSLKKTLTNNDKDLQTAILDDYTSGYPFLVSRLCKLIDEEICTKKFNGNKQKTWTKKGFQEAVKLILTEKKYIV